MSAMREYHHDPTMPAMEEEDVRGDGKKKKFKPLSAVRRLFGGRNREKRKKEEAKAHSSDALNEGGTSTDEDDGGFAVVRSISSDSIFSPEPREPREPRALSALTASNDSLAKSGFQSELFSKLSKRRSDGRSDGQSDDDGLPRSPPPSLTTADVVLGGGLQAPPKRRSNTRDSNQSLTSDFEEEEITQTKTRAPVANRKFSSESNLSKAMDLSSVPKTEVLASAPLKDRMSIKPRGRRPTHRQSRRDRTASPLSLPSLHEETPQSQTSDTHKESSPAKSPPVTGIISTSAKSHSVSSPHLSKPIVPKTAPKPGVASKPISPTTAPKPTSPLTVASQPTSPNTASKPTTSPISAVISPSPVVKVVSSKPTSPTPTSPINKPTEAPLPTLPPRPKSFVSSSPSSSSQSSTITSPSVTQQSGYKRSSGVYSGFTASFSSGSTRPGGQTSMHTSPNHNLGSETGVDKSKFVSPNSASAYADYNKKGDNSSQKQSPGGNKPPLPPSSFSSPSSSTPSPNSPSLKITDPESLVKLSPKEDYKIKRQSRSKTLPGASDEQTSPNIHRANSHRLQSSPKALQRNIDSTSSASISSSEKTGYSSSVGKLDSSRFSGIASVKSEPSWMDMVRKRREASENTKKDAAYTNIAEDQSKGNVLPTAKRPVSLLAGTSSQHSIYSSSAGNTDKRSSLYESSFTQSKGKVDQMLGLKTSDGSAVSPTQEKLDISVKELSAAREVKGPTTSYTGSSVKSPKDQPMASVPEPGASHHRSFSVKTSPTKFSADANSKPSFMNRPGSVKAQPSLASSQISKFQSVPLRKPVVTTSSSEDCPPFSSSTPPFSSSPPSAITQTTKLPEQLTTTPNVTTTPESALTNPITKFQKSSPVVSTSNITSAGENAASNVSSNVTSAVSVASANVSPSPSTASVSPSSTVAFGVNPLTSSNSHVKPSTNVSGVKSSFSMSSTSAFTGNNNNDDNNISITTSNSSSSSTSFRNSLSTTSSLSSSKPSFMRKDSPFSSATSTASSSSTSTTSVATTTATSSSTSSSFSSSFTSRGINPGRATSLRAPPSSSLISSSVSTQNIPSSSSSSSSSPKPFSITKSPSMRVPAASKQSSSSSSLSLSSSTGTDNSAPKVPNWRANLQKKKGNVEIEIIEKDSLAKPPVSSSGSQSQNLKISQVAERAKKTETPSVPTSERVTNRSSKVLDMLKNFENVQVST